MAICKKRKVSKEWVTTCKDIRTEKNQWRTWRPCERKGQCQAENKKDSKQWEAKTERKAWPTLRTEIRKGKCQKEREIKNWKQLQAEGSKRKKTKEWQAVRTENTSK